MTECFKFDIFNNIIRSGFSKYIDKTISEKRNKNQNYKFILDLPKNDAYDNFIYTFTKESLEKNIPATLEIIFKIKENMPHENYLKIFSAYKEIKSMSTKKLKLKIYKKLSKDEISITIIFDSIEYFTEFLCENHEKVETDELNDFVYLISNKVILLGKYGKFEEGIHDNKEFFESTKIYVDNLEKENKSLKNRLCRHNIFIIGFLTIASLAILKNYV